MWEAESHLDVDLFSNEYLWWEASGPQCPFILQRVFVHVETMGQKEIEWAICQGCWQALLGVDTKVDAPTIQVVGFKTTQREIWEIFNDVYHPKGLPGPPLCSLEWAEELAQEIMTSLKEHLWQRWDPTLLGGGQEQGPTRTSMPIIQLRPLGGHNRGMMTPVTVPSLKHGRLIIGHWWPHTY